MTRIAICIVDSHPMLYKEFALSLVGVTSFFNQWAKRGEYVLDVLLAETGYIDDMRNCLANKAVDEGYDYVFWMDSDMTFPADCLPRMLAYCEKDDAEAVSGLYVHKKPPHMPHVYPKIDEASGRFMMPVSFPLKEPFHIDGAGFGCLLMKTSVFKRVERPYFRMEVTDGKVTKGEDLDFCKETRMKMLLDPTISCGHLSLGKYTIDDYLWYNDIEKDADGWVSPTPEQQKKITEKMGHLQDGANMVK
uniref:Putative glycosyltransferase n=1 Tax=viral metagenome TaxID=1070528 RepID=A0A6M3XW00_9ZZZZ